jgi:hypothetical protein
MRFVAGNVTFNDFGGIGTGAVDDSVREGLRQSQFDIVFPSLGALHFPHYVHHALHNWIDGLAVGAKSDAEFKDQLLRTGVADGRLRIGR